MADTNLQPPVSAIVDREVLPGNQQSFEKALKGIIHASQQFPGYLGTDVFYPEEGNPLIYRVVFRYRTKEQLEAWENSPERQLWLETLDKLIIEPSRLRILTGLETWFALPKGKTVTPPQRYKMALITWLAITPLLIIFNLLAQPLLQNLSLIPRILVTSPFLVLLMTYLVMPFMAKLFSEWLYPPSKH